MNYNAGVNFSFAKSKIIYMDEAADTPEWQRRTNHPVDYLMVYKSDGFFQSQEEIDNYPHFADAKVGDVKFVDVNDDKVINGDDRIILSNSSTPKKLCMGHICLKRRKGNPLCQIDSAFLTSIHGKYLSCIRK